MLKFLAVKNFAIVRQAHLEFGKGMTVITGETGAGKSILIEALAIVLGQRAPSRLVSQDKKLSVSLCFDLSENSPAQQWLEEHSLDTGDECILQRAVGGSGGARAYINGTPATLNQMKEIGGMLADITGQNSHQQLLQSKKHLEFLDLYCGNQSQTEELRKLWQKWMSLSKQIENYHARQRETSSRIELLHYQVKELEELAPEQGEFEQIEMEHKRLAQIGQMIEHTRQVYDILYESDEQSIYTQIAHMCNGLQNFAAADENLARAKAELEAAAESIRSAVDEIATCLQKLPLPDEELHQIEKRLSCYITLSRRHQIAPRQLAEYCKRLNAELNHIDNPDLDIESLERQYDDCIKAYKKAALQTRQRRQQGARALENEINQLFRRLDMPTAHFSVCLEECDETPSATGFDHARFMIKTNAGQPLAPLQKIASGGELSRISLALQLAFVENHTIPALVFDEVDVGIGGNTAEMVGRLLHQLSCKVQVLCVTHLPQIAAFANHHYLVTKHSHADTTTVSARLLDDVKERNQEIARMLGGKKITARALAHAREMLADGSTRTS